MRIQGFYQLLVRCYRLACPYGRKRLAGVMALIFTNGLLQVVGVASIFPFFALAADPGRVQRSKVGSWVLGLLPEMTERELLVYSGILAIFLLIVSNGVTMLNEVLRERYVHGFGFWLKTQTMDRLGSRPYSYFLAQNSGTILQRLLSDINTVLTFVLLPLLDIISRGVTLLLLVGIILYVQPGAAVLAAVFLGIFYAAVFAFVRPRAQKVAMGLWQHNRGQMITAQQFLSGIKPAMVHGRTGFFQNRFRDHALQLAKLHPLMPIYSNTPRYIIEPLAFGGMVAMVVILAWQGRPFVDILPNLAVIALAGYKLLPTVQTIYSQLSNITAKSYTLGEVERELCEAELDDAAPATAAPAGPASPGSLPFTRRLQLDNITFSYAKAPTPALRDVSLEIFKNENIGIVGTTGSGKSTLVDLILGLHQNQQGAIRVDDLGLTPALLPAWRAKIGYVPQEIFLMDDTIAANIAFGIPSSEINLEKLRRAASVAQILGFIENELPLGFAAVVGERGVRLSGGQRQRIGLARAFYHEPEILILDEATSALDGATEAAVMQTIHQLHGTLTIITIAHRLTTLDRCDRILRLEAGRLVQVEPIDPTDAASRKVGAPALLEDSV